MLKDRNWFCISLFCSKEYWHILLNDGIKAFLKQNRFNYNYFQVALNYIGGDNIRFSIEIFNDAPGEVAKYIEHYFKNFFKEYNFPTGDYTLPVEDIFLPFPNNTIQFGLYKPVTFDDNEYLNHYVQELSNIIINGLGEDSVDAEIMITFAFYLHLGLLKINLQYSELNIFFDDFKTKFNENNSNLSLRILFERYEENETMLEEIYQDIIKKSDIDLPWLAKWISLCESFKQNHSHLSIIDIHKRQVHLINKYLGLPRNMEKILYHFLIKILESKLIDETREMDKLV